MELLFNLMNNKENINGNAAENRVVLPVELMVRNSCG